jgi:hypothetical protein
MSNFDLFVEKNQKIVKSGTLFIHLKTHGTNFRGDRLIHCRLNFRTKIGPFYSRSDGWGVLDTFVAALDRLDRQIRRQKEKTTDTSTFQSYYEAMGFYPPLSFRKPIV